MNTIITLLDYAPTPEYTTSQCLELNREAVPAGLSPNTVSPRRTVAHLRHPELFVAAKTAPRSVMAKRTADILSTMISQIRFYPQK
jgi:hypothetical protein